MGTLDNIDQWFQLPPEMDQFILKQVEYGMFGCKSHYWKHIIRELMLGNKIQAYKKNDIPRPK